MHCDILRVHGGGEMNVTTSTPAPVTAPTFALSHFSHDPGSYGRQTLLRDGVPFAYVDLVYAPQLRREGDGALVGCHMGVLLDTAIPCFEATVSHRDMSGVLEALLVKGGVDVAEVAWAATKLLMAPKVKVSQ